MDIKFLTIFIFLVPENNNKRPKFLNCITHIYKKKKLKKYFPQYLSINETTMKEKMVQIKNNNCSMVLNIVKKQRLRNE